MSYTSLKEGNSSAQPSGVDLLEEVIEEGRGDQESGPVVRTVGTPLTNWTIGGENQCPLPLYQSTALL